MIEVRNLFVKLGDKQIFHDFNAEFPDEGTVLVSGESGIGKTTLLRVICGLQKPDVGFVTGIKERRISVVFQEPRLLEHLSAIDNVAVVSDKKRAEDLMLRLNLGNELHLKAGALSGGQKQRVSIARAFAFSDDVVLLDEPFTGLDEQNKKRVADLIHTARLAIIVTHVPSDVELLNIDRKITL